MALHAYSGNAATSRPVQSSEVAVDWQEPMVLQRKLRPSIARVNVQLDPRHAASKHTTAPINHTYDFIARLCRAVLSRDKLQYELCIYRLCLTLQLCRINMNRDCRWGKLPRAPQCQRDPAIHRVRQPAGGPVSDRSSPRAPDWLSTGLT